PTEVSTPSILSSLRLSCAKLLICLVTSQCFLHRTEGEISTLFWVGTMAGRVLLIR
ncbi:hypothetical protein ATANTOWER_026641, partial [Ataeniobius toweri]|nr:hypothetical protein [Ataeniobius toweri]